MCPSTRSDRRGSTNLTAVLTMEVTTQHVKRIDQLGTTNIGTTIHSTDNMTVSLSGCHPQLMVIHFQLKEIFNQLGCGCLRGIEDFSPTYTSYIPFPSRVSPYKLKHCFPMPVQLTRPHTRIPAYESSPNVTLVQRPCSGLATQPARAVWFFFVPIPRSCRATNRRGVSRRTVSSTASLA